MVNQPHSLLFQSFVAVPLPQYNRELPHSYRLAIYKKFITEFNICDITSKSCLNKHCWTYTPNAKPLSPA